MGNGRKSIPDELKIVRGTFRPGRENKDKPNAPVVIHTAPEHLSDLAKEMFEKVAKMTGDLGMVRNLDAAAIEQVAAVYAEWRQANTILTDEGPYYETTSTTGGLMKRAHPMLAARSDAARRLHSLMVEFGMTPASRSKVSGTNDTSIKDDPAAKYGF